MKDPMGLILAAARTSPVLMEAARAVEARIAELDRRAARITKLEAAGKRLRRAHEYAENFVIRRGETLLDFAAGENWDNVLNPKEPTVYELPITHPAPMEYGPKCSWIDATDPINPQEPT